MEIAKNVREFLVGMKESLSDEEERLLASLQDLHERYLTIMDEFSVQVSELALSMSPEARMVAHQLRLKIYQDWRAKLMERIFASTATASSTTSSPPSSLSSNSSTASMATSPRTTSNQLDEDDETEDEDLSAHCDNCVCEMSRRLKRYEQVIADYIKASTRIKTRRTSTLLPTTAVATADATISKASCDPPDGSDPESDEQDEYVFEMPAFLSTSPLRDAINT